MENKYHKYHLEKYNGRGTRHECPKCHDKHSFTYFVDETGAFLDPSVGRCDHESSCGYIYTPKDWFKDHPQLTDRNTAPRHRPSLPAIPRPRPDYIVPELVSRSCSTRSGLYKFLSTLISSETLARVWRDYCIGATKDEGVIYWQIDRENRVRTGKVIKYDPETGHRIKGGPSSCDCNWIHAILKRRGDVSKDFSLVQCLFGEHLLNLHPDRVVALVEAEKTAVVGACIFPQYVWIATGGKSQLAPEKMKVLEGRRVFAFPDVDAFQDWSDAAKGLARHGISMKVADVLERRASDEDRAAKIDIADWILRELERHPEKDFIFQRLVKQNPDFEKFFNDFDLEVVS